MNETPPRACELAAARLAAARLAAARLASDASRGLMALITPRDLAVGDVVQLLPMPDTYGLGFDFYNQVVDQWMSIAELNPSGSPRFLTRHGQIPFTWRRECVHRTSGAAPSLIPPTGTALADPTEFKTGDRALARWHTGGFVSGTVCDRAQTGAGWWFTTDDGEAFVARELRKPDPVRDYAASRAVIDANALLDGLDEFERQSLSFGNITGRSVQLAASRMGGTHVGHPSDWMQANELAFALNQMVAAAKLLEAKR